MSKWEDFAKIDRDNNAACPCTSHKGLFVPNRQLSALVAGLLFLFFCIFISGYFLGKKYSVEQYADILRINAENDDLYVSMIPLNEVAHGNDTVSLSLDMEKNAQSLEADKPLFEKAMAAAVNESLNTAIDNEGDKKNYYAQLIGFGTERAAEQFVKRLASNGIVTEIKKRVSKTVKGRTSYWYQVITTAYSDKNDLSRIVDKLVKEEKLKGVSIQCVS